MQTERNEILPVQNMFVEKLRSALGNNAVVQIFSYLNRPRDNN